MFSLRWTPFVGQFFGHSYSGLAANRSCFSESPPFGVLELAVTIGAGALSVIFLAVCLAEPFTFRNKLRTAERAAGSYQRH